MFNKYRRCTNHPNKLASCQCFYCKEGLCKYCSKYEDEKYVCLNPNDECQSMRPVQKSVRIKF